MRRRRRNGKVTNIPNIFIRKKINFYALNKSKLKEIISNSRNQSIVIREINQLEWEEHVTDE